MLKFRKCNFLNIVDVLRSGLIGCAVFSAVGCSLSGVHTKPTLTGAPVAPVKLRSTVQLLEKQATQIATFRGLSRSLFIEEDSRSAARHVIVFKAPDSVRIELLPPGAAYALQLLATHDGKGSAYDSSQREAVVGTIDRSVMRKLLGIGLQPEEIVLYLLGRLPRSFTQSSLTMYCSQHSSDCQLFDKNLIQYAEIKKGSRRLQKVVLRNQDSERVKLVFTYSEYHDLGALEYPSVVSLSIIESDLEIRMRFSMAKFNVPVPDELFSVAIPEGYTVHNTDR